MSQVSSIIEIHDGLKSEIGYATVKRILTKLISQNLISPIGSGRGRKYVISPAYDLFYSLDIEEYFNKEVDERIIKNRYNANLIRNLLNNVRLFTDEELQNLLIFSKHIKEIFISQFEFAVRTYF